MADAVVFGKVGDEYRVARIKNASLLKSKYRRDREHAASALEGWRYIGSTFKYYAAAFAEAQRLQQIILGTGEVPIFELQFNNGAVKVTECT